jgi:hypothetical protein
MTQDELLRAMLIKHTAIEFPDVSRSAIAALVDFEMANRMTVRKWVGKR